MERIRKMPTSNFSEISQKVLDFKKEKREKEQAFETFILERVFGEMAEETEDLGKPVEVEILKSETREGYGPQHSYTSPSGFTDMVITGINEVEIVVKITVRELQSQSEWKKRMGLS